MVKPEKEGRGGDGRMGVVGKFYEANVEVHFLGN